MFTGRPSLAAAAALVIMFSMGALYAWSVFVAPLGLFLGPLLGGQQRVLPRGRHVHVVHAARRAPLPIRAPPRPSPWPPSASPPRASCSPAWLLIAAVMIGFGGLFGFANGLGYGFSLQLAEQARPHWARLRHRPRCRKLHPGLGGVRAVPHGDAVLWPDFDLLRRGALHAGDRPGRPRPAPGGLGRVP